MAPRSFHLTVVLLGCAVAKSLQGLPPGVTLVSPRSNATHVTDAVFVSVAFDVLGRCVMGSQPAAPGCTICAALDRHPQQCVRQADSGASELTTGMAFRLGLDVRYLPSGNHSLVLSFLGFDPAASGQEYNLDVSFTSSRFADGVTAPRSKPRTLIDAFTFFDEMDVLELRLRELENDVDLFVVAESPFTHSMRPKPLHLAEALAAKDPRWAPWASRLRCVALDPADLLLLQQRGDFHGHEVLQRNILAGAVETILRNEFLFGRRDKFGAYAIDDLVILVSDVDEVPSRAALHNLRFHAQSLAAVTYLSMAWHHYAFNFGSRMLWGDMSTNQHMREASMALTPDQLVAAAAAATNVGAGATLTQLRRGVRDQIAVPGAVLHLGGWHLQRFGGDSKVASKLGASPYAAAFALGNNDLSSSGLEGHQLARELIGAGLVMTYPHNLNNPITLASATFDWAPKRECALWWGLALPLAAENQVLAQRGRFWAPRPAVSSEAASQLRWTVVARDLRKAALAGGTLALVATDHVTDSGIGRTVDETCTVPCGMQLISAVEQCRWRLALTVRVGRLAAEIAAEQCSRLFPLPASFCTFNGTTAAVDRGREVVLRFKLQRIVPLEIDVSGHSVNLVLSADFVAIDRLAVGARASASHVVDVACKRFLRGDSTMCLSLSAHALRLAQVLELFFIPVATTSVQMGPISGSFEVPLVFACDAPPIEVAELFCLSKGISQGIVSLGRLEGERIVLSDPQSCVPKLASRIIQIQAGIGIDDGSSVEGSGGNQGVVCARRQEDLLDLPLRHALTLVQFRMLDHQQYLGVQTWKFPNDLWVYTELIMEVRPTVILEIGNNAGGSALYLANYLQTIYDYEIREGAAEPLNCRIICVDINHSKLHPRALQHPRVVEWILADGPTAGSRVRVLLRPDDKIMVIEDASHLRGPTLDLLEEFGPLVAQGSYFIVEDTVLHNGATNPLFDDPGAHASVDDFLRGHGAGSDGSPQCTRNGMANGRYIGEDFVSDRFSERFIFSWNPTGFLKRVGGEGWGDSVRAKRDAQKLLDAKQVIEAADNLNGTVEPCTTFAVQCAVTMDINAVPHVFRFSDEMATMASVLVEAKHFCESLLHFHSDDATRADCARMLRARCMAWATRAHETPDLFLEASTHPSKDLFVPVSSTVDGMEVSVSAIFKKSGVFVLDRAFVDGVASLKARIKNKERNPQFEAILASLSGVRHKSSENSSSESLQHSRYMDVLCQWKTDEACRRSGGPLGSTEVLEFIQNEFVLMAVETVLGTQDVLVDSVSLSIQWPGDAPFGPHVDRPIKASSDSPDNWPYSAHFQAAANSPTLSVQALWCLHGFTESNGAFFIDKSTASGRRTVLTRAGDVVIANGGVNHGANANFMPIPRVALLVQYVPRFVRPGARFPRAVLDAVHNPDVSARLARLLDLDKADNDPSLTVSVERSPGVSETFVPPWSNARAAAGAVIRADVEQFCGGAQNRACALSLQEEVYRMALLEYHGGSASSTTALDIKPRSEEVHSAPLALQDPKATLLLSNGKMMPSLAFGTGGRSADEVRSALHVGFSHLDLAESYGNEAELGSLFRSLGWDALSLDVNPADGTHKLRSEVFVSSKVWATNLDAVGAALDQTLETTGLHYLDLYMIHWPVPLRSVGLAGPSEGLIWPLDESGNVLLADVGGGPMSLILSAWRELEHAFDSGKLQSQYIRFMCNRRPPQVRAIGVSNMPTVLLRFLIGSARIQPHVHQFEAHPQLPQVGLLRFCLQHGIVPMAHSALGGPSSGFEELASDPSVVAAVAILRSNEEASMTLPQLFLQWALQRRCGAVVSSRSEVHQRELLVAGTVAVASLRAGLELLDGIPRLRYRRRVLPPAFSFLFADQDA